LQDPISKKIIHRKKRAGGTAQGVGPEFKPQYRKKKKKVRIKLMDGRINKLWYKETLSSLKKEGNWDRCCRLDDP
jgi:hypothetical protein